MEQNIKEPSISKPDILEIKSKIFRGKYTVRGKHGRSRVWEIFGEIINEMGEQIPKLLACTKCKNIMRYNGLVTSNLVKHKCFRELIASKEVKRPRTKSRKERVFGCVKMPPADKNIIMSGNYKARCNRNGSSKIWEIYSLVENEMGELIPNVVVCNKCKNFYAYNRQVTTNLLRHNCYKSRYKSNNVLRTSDSEQSVDNMSSNEDKHSNEIVSVKEENTIDSLIEGGYDTNENYNLENQEEFVDTNQISNLEEESKGITLTQQLDENTKEQFMRIYMEWILNNCRPLNSIEDSGMKSLASFLISVGARYGPNNKVNELLPNKKTLSQNINNLYNACFNKVKSEIAEIKNIGFGISSHIWTNNFTKNTHMALTIHYIKGGNLLNKLLGLLSITRKNCDGEHIRLKVQALLREFDCDLDDKVLIVIDNDVKNINAFRADNHIFCINHLIAYVLQKSIEEVSAISALCCLCSKVVKYLARADVSSELQSTLESYAEKSWNREFHLLSACRKHWDEIVIVLEKDGKLQSTFYEWSNVNLQTLNSIVNLLKYFEEVFQKLGENNDATLHWTVFYIHKLKKKCLEANNCKVLQDFKEKLMFYIDNSLIENLSIYHKIALFLFPPANKLLQYTSKEKYTIKEKCKSIMRVYKDSQDDFNYSQQFPKEDADLFDDFFVQPTNDTIQDKITKEINSYETVNVVFNENFNILKWWNSHQNDFPLLYKLSCRILATPASNSISERIFYKAKNLMDDNFSNQIMFLHANMNCKVSGLEFVECHENPLDEL